jgi:hypothetical protein
LDEKSRLGPGVELLHKGHRYIAAGINPVTKKHKRWRDADKRLLKEPPRPQDFAWLLDELVLELMRDANGTEVRGLATPEAATALLGDLPTGVMDVGVRDLMTRALADLSGLNGSRHDATLGHVRDLVKYGAAGLAGTDTALKALRADFIEAVWDDAERGSRDVAGAEFDRMKINGAQLAAAKSAEELANFGASLKAVAPKGIWHPDTLWPACDEERVTRSLADVVPTKVRWLWPYWIPLGKVSILEGEPGEGKSLLTLVMTALVTTGREWPMTMVEGAMQPRTTFGPAGVVLVGVEDDEADTVVPRLASIFRVGEFGVGWCCCLAG